MAHKVLVGGTSYDITKGRTLIGGTGYDVTKGRTLVGGTGYDISFTTAGFDEVMADATIDVIAGRNASTTGNVTANLNLSASGTFYVIQLHTGYLSFVRVDAVYNGEGVAPTLTQTVVNKNGTSTLPYIVGDTTGAGQPRIVARVSTNGTSATSVYGSVIAIVHFPSYTPNIVDAALQSVSITRIAGRNNSSTARVSGSYANSYRWFVALPQTSIGYMAYSSPLGTVIFSNNTTNPSCLCAYTSTVWALSTDGTTASMLYGGSIVRISDAGDGGDDW